MAWSSNLACLSAVAVVLINTLQPGIILAGYIYTNVSSERHQSSTATSTHIVVDRNLGKQRDIIRGQPKRQIPRPIARRRLKAPPVLDARKHQVDAPIQKVIRLVPVNRQ